MEALLARLFKRFDRKAIELEVEEELRFHIELLTRGHIEQGMSLEAAKDAALRRFGDAERIKDQCVEISRRSHPLMRALKSFLILVFLTGILARVFSADFHVRQVGDMLIVVAALSWLFLYIRGLSSSSFRSKPETTLQLRWSEGSQVPIPAYDERKLTPVERVISDE